MFKTLTTFDSITTNSYRNQSKHNNASREPSKNNHMPAMWGGVEQRGRAFRVLPGIFREPCWKIFIRKSTGNVHAYIHSKHANVHAYTHSKHANVHASVYVCMCMWFPILWQLISLFLYVSPTPWPTRPLISFVLLCFPIPWPCMTKAFLCSAAWYMPAASGTTSGNLPGPSGKSRAKPNIT